MNLTKKDFISYYKKYKELSQLHQKLFKKNAKPNIPSLYSESLCRFLYKMNKSDIKEYDAIFEENRIEIKATSSNSGTTTINPYSKFDFLYWLYIDVETDHLQVTKIPYKNFEELFSTVDIKKDKQQKLRINICLSNFKQNCEIDNFNLMTLSK